MVQRIRDIVLGADPRIDERIEWPAPTFTYEGNLASDWREAESKK